MCVALVSMSFANATLAQPAAPAQLPVIVVSPTEQSSRDDERLRILRDELKKAESLLEALGRRKAERLAASDVVAADQAEEDRIRAVSDIAGLRREIAATRPASEAKAPGSGGSSIAPVRSAAGKSSSPSSTSPWWDVYSKARRTPDTPASISLAQPPATAEPATQSPRRPE